jgi:radical SAM superfamily enzyme YgiQ (UPF0313 family)
MKDITLINPVFPSNITIPPYGLLSLVAILEQEGYSVDLRDYQIHENKDPWDTKNFLDFIKNSSDIIGISTYSFNLPFILIASQHLKKKHPEKKIILGGIGVTGVAVELIRAFSSIDIIIRGEGEITLLRLLSTLEKGSSLKNIRGLIYRNKKKIHITPKNKRIVNLDNLPYPAFDKIDFSKYDPPNIMYSRGCPFHCTFCDIAPYWGRRNLKKSLSYFMEEIRILREEYRQKRLAIVDDTFVLKKNRVLEFCSTLKKENLDIEWGCYGKVDLMDSEMIKKMANANCKKIYYGIESGNDKVLQEMKKGFSINKALKIIDRSLQYIDIVQTSFVWGFPFESIEQFYDTILTIIYLVKKGAAVKAAMLTPFPLSHLYRELKHTLKFSKKLSPSLYIAGYYNRPEIIHLIKNYKDVFPAFYYYDVGDVKEKYRISRELGLSTEEIFDAWEKSNY